MTWGSSKRICARKPASGVTETSRKHLYRVFFLHRHDYPNKGTQCPIEFWPSACAQRISGYSAAPSMGPSLVSQIWGLIAEELEGYQRRSLGWVAKARRTRHRPMGSDAQLRLRNFGPMPTPGIDVLKHQIALWDFAFLCWNLTRFGPYNRERQRIRLHTVGHPGPACVTGRMALAMEPFSCRPQRIGPVSRRGRPLRRAVRPPVHSGRPTLAPIRR